MKWEIQYRRKGDSNIRKKTFDLSLDKKKQVKKWFLSTRLTVKAGDKNHKFDKVRQDYEFINCKKIINIQKVA